MISNADAAKAADMQVTEQQADFLNTSFWCWSCLCFGGGCTECLPLCWSQRKILCIQETTTSGEPCRGPTGYCSGVQKICCLTRHSQFPPRPCMCSICNIFCIGDRPVAASICTADEVENIALLQNTCWLWYCCCDGVGLIQPNQ